MYQIAATSERKYDWGDGIESLAADEREVGKRADEAIDKLTDAAGASESIVCFSCSSRRYWRHDLWPLYKAHRSHGRKPVLLDALREYLLANYPNYQRPGLEADDILGILSTGTKIPGEKVIVTTDKDMKQIPGKLYNPNKPEDGVVEISPEAADRFHLYQTIVGDSTDGYPGCPGLGPKKAEKFLDRGWPGVVEAFASRLLTEEDALLQARVARICRVDDYDFRGKKVRLWTPRT
jgi:DNA polymerase-1